MKQNKFGALWKNIRVLVLATLLGLAVYIAVRIATNTQSMMFADLLTGISISLLSTIAGLYIFWDINRKDTFELKDISTTIKDAINNREQTPFSRVDLNRKMGDEYWINLIANLGKTPKDVWFAGTKLSTWLKLPVYSRPLKEKFYERFRGIILTDAKVGKVDGFMSYILLADSQWLPKWRNFLQGIISDLSKDTDTEDKKERYKELCWSKIIFATLPENIMKYSIVVCDDRMSVTQYLTSGRAVDSPTMDIKTDTDMYYLYLDDLKELLRIASISAENAVK